MVAKSSTSPSPGSRHSRESVLDAAMELLDSYGLPELSMRRIAKVLELQPSALYWHFPSKQDLLAALSSRIVNRQIGRFADSVDATAGDAESLVASFRDQLLAHRDGAELVSSSFALGLVELPVLSALRKAFAMDDMAPDDATVAAETLIHFTLGYVFHEQQRAQADSLDVTAFKVALTPKSVETSANRDTTLGFLGGVALFIRGVCGRVECKVEH